MKKKRILLVEDDPSQAQLLSRWLEVDGDFEVMVAHDGLSGFELAPSQRWDLIISDVLMPRMNGFDFVRHCKMSFPEPRCCL